jgi:pimeloyl-ACP methyl ester carboxylesterase
MMTDISIRSGELSLAASVYGAATNPPVLFLHGLGMSRDTWFENAMRLCGEYQVWCLDFRGHGHSSRADSYLVTDYRSDVEAALAAIGRPAFIVGHSMGGAIAGMLARAPHPLVAALLMIDPPLFYAHAGEYARTVFPARFAALAAYLKKLRKINASLQTYVDLVANTPHAIGGFEKDAVSARHVLSQASSLQRQDVACWNRPMQEVFAAVDPDVPFRVPVEIINIEDQYGAALLEDQAQRIAQVTSGLRLTRYDGADPFPYRTFAFQDRFAEDLSDRLAAWRAAM